MTLAELGPDLLEHILDFVPDSLRSWAVLPRVNKLFKAAESRWHFKVVARDKMRQHKLDKLACRRSRRICHLEVGDNRDWFKPAEMMIPDFPFLTKLELVRCATNFTLGTVPPSVKELVLWMCDVDDDGLRCLPATLETLTLAGCTKVSGASLACLRNLRHLRLHYMDSIEAAFFPKTLLSLELLQCECTIDIPQLPELQKLIVRLCCNVQSIATQPKLIEALVTGCNCLEDYYVWNYS